LEKGCKIAAASWNLPPKIFAGLQRLGTSSLAPAAGEFVLRPLLCYSHLLI